MAQHSLHKVKDTEAISQMLSNKPNSVKHDSKGFNDEASSISEVSRSSSPPISSRRIAGVGNFAGVRGGAAEDAELLAELRAISSGSSSASRFESDGAIGDAIEAGGKSSLAADIPPWKKRTANGTDRNVKTSMSPGSNCDVVDEFSQQFQVMGKQTTSKGVDGLVPPWKKQQASSSSSSQNIGSVIEVTGSASIRAHVAGESTVSQYKNTEVRSTSPPISKQSAVSGNTFRGGAAEDADLLAELRAISSSSFSASRFRSDDGATGASEEKKASNSKIPMLGDSAEEFVDASLPPWKRGKAAARVKSSRPENALNPSEKKIQSTNKKEDSVGAADECFFPEAKASNNNRVDASESPLSLDVRSESPPISKRSAVNVNSFAGERGGAAEDADLLAELRAISSSSSSASRFRSGDGATGASNETKANNSKFPMPGGSAEEFVDANLPPWKRGKAAARVKSSRPENALNPSEKKIQSTNKKEDSVGAADECFFPEAKASNNNRVDASESPLSLDVRSASPPISKRSAVNVNSFAGERGGAAEDADLLAELRAISSSSSSASRFRSGDGATGASNETKANNSKFPMPSDSAEEFVDASLPPWKRGKAAARGKSSRPENALNPSEKKIQSTNKKEDSVDAADECFFPEAKASNNNRVDASESPLSLDVRSASPPISKRSVVNVNSFAGERGGAAEDADLLAELRAISSSSSSASRFGSGDGVTGASDETKANYSKFPMPSDSAEEFVDASLPPWKRGKAATRGKSSRPESALNPPEKNVLPTSKNEDSIGAADECFFSEAKIHETNNKRVDASEPPLSLDARSASPPISKRSVLNINSFVGERGGTAEDADLLAELRAISSGSSSASRFGSGCKVSVASDEHNRDTGCAPLSVNVTEESSTTNANDSANANVPPWKREKAAVRLKTSTGVAIGPDAPEIKARNLTSESFLSPDVRSASPPISKRSAVNVHNFAGERGGAAEDADLLAELGAISSSSSSTSRFGSGDRVSGASNETTANHSNIQMLGDSAEESVDASFPPWKRGKAATRGDSRRPENALDPPKKKNLARNNNEGSRDAAFDCFASESKIHATNNLRVAASESPLSLDVRSASPPISKRSVVNANSFAGERGGAAEDADLLAELRAISSSSSSTSRFGSGDGASVASDENKASNSIIPISGNCAGESIDVNLPPWKRGKAVARGNSSKQEYALNPP